MVVLRMQPIETYLAEIIRPLLKSPEAVKISQSTDDMGILLTVTLAKDDMGVVIGKSGETAKAIRHLVRILGVKNNARVSVKITEPDGSSYRPKFKEEPDRELVDSR